MFKAFGSFFRMLEKLFSAGETSAEALDVMAGIGLDKAKAAKAQSDIDLKKIEEDAQKLLK